MCGLSSGAAAGSTGAVAGLNAQLSGIFGNLGTLGAASIALAAVFPNGYAIFSAFAYFFLGALTMPVNLFNANAALPLELRIMLIALFGLLNIFAVGEYLGAKRF